MKRTRKEPHKITVPTKNRYDPLAEMETDEYKDDGSNTASDDSDNAIEITNPPKPRKPPPLVVHGQIEEHTTFLRMLTDMLKEKFHIKYHKEFTEVFTTNQS
ncbi:hypothetical protein KPH14_012925, partial [Odynerus spinipes]